MPITIPKLSERVVQIEDLSFTVGPETFEDFSASLGFIARNSLVGSVAGMQGAAYMIARRIVAWTGVMVDAHEEQGGMTARKPAECTDANKMALFAVRPDLLHKIATAVAEQEADDRKNSSPTQPA